MRHKSFCNSRKFSARREIISDSITSTGTLPTSQTLTTYSYLVDFPLGEGFKLHNFTHFSFISIHPISIHINLILRWMKRKLNCAGKTNNDAWWTRDVFWLRRKSHKNYTGNKMNFKFSTFKHRCTQNPFRFHFNDESIFHITIQALKFHKTLNASWIVLNAFSVIFSPKKFS